MKEVPAVDLVSFDLQTHNTEYSRKVKEETLIRSMFRSFRYQIRGHPKKEYLRCKLIRGHKRANRKIKKNKLLYNDLSEMTEGQAHCWEALSKVYHQNSPILDYVSKTQFEPIKVKRSARPTTVKSKSFNTDFCKKYFSDINVRKSFYYYINFIFFDLDPERLSKYLGFVCCGDERHTIDCAYRWMLMKRYTQEIIVKDLKLNPWFPQTDDYVPGIMNYCSD